MSEGSFRSRTQGTECQCKVAIRDYRNENLSFKEERICGGLAGYYDGSEQRFYYERGNHLLESDLDQTEAKCLCRIPEEYGINNLTVNDKGIFAVCWGNTDENEISIILWFAHDGKLIKKIPLKRKIVQTYICSSLIFYRRAEYVNEGKMSSDSDCSHCPSSAYWMDMTTETENIIFQARKEKAQKAKCFDEYSNCRVLDVRSLIGNDKGAVFKLSSWYYCVDEDDMDKTIEEGTEGWYFYDFQKIYCLSHSKCRPDTLYYRPWEYKEQQRLCAAGKAVWHRDIEAFNMEKNLMWISRQKGGKKFWVPMNITADPKQCPRPDLPVWQIPDLVSDKYHFFDGDRLYCYQGRSLCSFDPKGQKEEWPIGWPWGDCEDIFRFGDYVFVYGAESSGYSITERFVCPASHAFGKILRVWDAGSRVRSEEEYQLIHDFDNAPQADENDWERYDAWEETEIEDLEVESRESEKESEGRQTGQYKIPASQLEYWADFRTYAVEKGINTRLKLSEAADHNWYAIRLGSAIFRIECSVNTRKETIRAAFFVKKAPEIFARLEQAESAIETGMGRLGEIVWDGGSQAANVSVIASRRGKSTAEQYEWFCQAVEKLYDVIAPYLGL